MIIEVKKLMLCLLYQFKIRTLLFLFGFFELKERVCIRRKINSQRKVFTWEINIIIILIWWKLGWVVPVQQKIKLPSPNITCFLFIISFFIEGRHVCMYLCMYLFIYISMYENEVKWKKYITMKIKSKIE